MGADAVLSSDVCLRQPRPETAQGVARLSFRRGLRSQKFRFFSKIENNKQNEGFPPSPLKASAAMGLAQKIMTALVYGRQCPCQDMTA